MASKNASEQIDPAFAFLARFVAASMSQAPAKTEPSSRGQSLPVHSVGRIPEEASASTTPPSGTHRKRSRNDCSDSDVKNQCASASASPAAVESAEDLANRAWHAVKKDIPWFPWNWENLCGTLHSTVNGEMGLLTCPLCTKSVETKRTDKKKAWSVLDFSKHVQECLISRFYKRVFAGKSPTQAELREYFIDA
ncbi:uncharacterized protein LOC117639922 isoform X2 [Thrips palmi]|uniref:Uncharacterized protein LOC117639922 isoform X2 n=1 Tax=Thrips palmi TaxID=161013 RepID=A0A6P8Y5U0_THRPL|nr:uncharacterized protein LOC117639922 isoform X2 [Thrips palmi]XP_034231882.1 uncharacterized protein LOC117639922 isoform X2 [Thrips palmi]